MLAYSKECVDCIHSWLPAQHKTTPVRRNSPCSFNHGTLASLDSCVKIDAKNVFYVFIKKQRLNVSLILPTFFRVMQCNPIAIQWNWWQCCMTKSEVVNNSLKIAELTLEHRGCKSCSPFVFYYHIFPSEFSIALQRFPRTIKVWWNDVEIFEKVQPVIELHHRTVTVKMW